MDKLSNRSRNNLLQVHKDLKLLAEIVSEHYPCEVICGHRTEKDQNQAVLMGNSKTPWPRSKHNKLPSEAIDIVPTPIDWKNREAFYHFAGFVQGIAAALEIKIRWGGDWDGDRDLKNQKFFDLVHFELVPDVPLKLVPRSSEQS